MINEDGINEDGNFTFLDYLERRMLSRVIDHWGNLHCMRQEPKSEIETASVADSVELQGYRKISSATSHLSERVRANHRQPTARALSCLELGGIWESEFFGLFGFLRGSWY